MSSALMGGAHSSDQGTWHRWQEKGQHNKKARICAEGRECKKPVAVGVDAMGAPSRNSLTWGKVHMDKQ